MKILFITDNFPPEVNAPARRTFEHCKEWVNRGEEVTVITCFPNYPKGRVFDGYQNSLYKKETIEGIKVIRVWSFITANSGFLKRVIDHISFAISAIVAAIFNKRPDVIIATSPQFFSAIAGACISVLRKRPWIMEIRDLWPESIAAVGLLKKNKFYSLLEKIELNLYRWADGIVVVTDSFKKNLIQRNINSNKIFVIKNGIDRTSFYPRKNKPKVLPKELQNKFIIGYIGTHGLAHNLMFILQCAQKMQNVNNLHFIFIGDGAEKKNLIAWNRTNNLQNISFYNSIDKEEVPNYIACLDVALITLKKSKTFESVLPSKIFENAAMGVPILLGVEGEAQRLIEHYHAGICFVPENQDSFISCLRKLKNDPIERKKMKIGGYNLAKDFDRNTLAEEMLKVIKGVNK